MRQRLHFLAWKEGTSPCLCSFARCRNFCPCGCQPPWSLCLSVAPLFTVSLSLSLRPSNWQTVYSLEMLWVGNIARVVEHLPGIYRVPVSIPGTSMPPLKSCPNPNRYCRISVCACLPLQGQDSWSLSNACPPCPRRESVGVGDALSTVLPAQQLMESCHLAFSRMSVPPETPQGPSFL